ncbi:MAG: tetratricopeptide repeat protein [Cellulomonadaceae bacterium]|nr:tetratricopeptide repeat protein [Cellulomonadaceae bacterium]
MRATVAPDSPELAAEVAKRDELEWRLSWGEAKAMEDDEDYEGAAARHRTWLGERSLGGTRDAVLTAHSSTALGRCVSLAGRPEDAQQILREAHARAAVDLGPTHEATRWFLTERARAYRRVGDHPAELAILTELYTDEIAAIGQADRETILTMADLALVYERLREIDEARRFAGLAISNAVLVFGDDDPFTQRRRDALASLLPTDADYPPPS